MERIALQQLQFFAGDNQKLANTLSLLVKRSSSNSMTAGLRYVVTLNPLMWMQLSKDPVLQKYLLEADMVLIDGIGLKWALMRQLNKTFIRHSGVDLVNHIFKKSYSIYCIGASPETIEKVYDRWRKEFKNVALLGTHHGYLTESEQERLMAKIIEKQPDIILVGMGVPKQESFINKLKPYMRHGVAIGVGGSFDSFTGQVKRCPSWVQRVGFEWLFRALREPGRFKKIPMLISFFIKYCLRKEVYVAPPLTISKKSST